jgi:hypothetical protein
MRQHLIAIIAITATFIGLAKASEYTERTAQKLLRVTETCPTGTQEEREYSKQIILEANKIAKVCAASKNPALYLSKVEDELPAIVEAMFPNETPEDKQYSQEALLMILTRLLQGEHVIP